MSGRIALGAMNMLVWITMALRFVQLLLPAIIITFGIYELIFRSVLIGLLVIGAATVLAFVLRLIVAGLFFAMASLGNSITDEELSQPVKDD